MEICCLYGKIASERKEGKKKESRNLQEEREYIYHLLLNTFHFDNIRNPHLFACTNKFE